jgi:acetyl esterase/lipase
VAVVYDPNARYDIDERDVAYREVAGQPLLARLYRPRGAGPFPALIALHGGAWTRGDRLSHLSLVEPLAASGIVIVSLDFRQAPDHPYPASIQDVNYGVRWLKAHATEFHADTSQIGALGESSGGHQAMLVGMLPGDPRYAADAVREAPGLDASLRYVICTWPILDPYARYLFAKDTGRDDLVTRTEGYFRTAGAMKEGSPQALLDRRERVETPPVIIMQGTADVNVTPAMQERFASAYRAAGGVCELHLFPDMGHGGWPKLQSEQALDLTKAFIGRRLAG